MPTIRERIRNLAPDDRRRYEEIAESFEAALVEAESLPDLAAFLPQESELRLPTLVELLRCEIEHRVRNGEQVAIEEFRRRFPILANDADALAELTEWLARLSNPIPPPPTWEAPAGYRIDFAKPLGRGGWGIVYKAFNQSLARDEALKVIKPDLLRNNRKLQEQIRQMQAEIPLAAGLNHPNIVHLYNTGESKGIPYFLMEYCPGGSLEEKLRKERISPREAAELLRTLANAVQAVHNFGIIHRDLKPSNVLFGIDGMPKIADFGLAVPVRDLPSEAFVGTAAYMPPEQADPRFGKVNETSDVYGLGAILHRCLTGEDLGRGISRKLGFGDAAAICRKCLQADQAKRYPSASALADDLGRFLRQEPVRARRYWWPHLMWKWGVVNPVKTLLALVVLLVLASVLKFRSDAAAAAEERADKNAELLQAQIQVTNAKERALQAQIQLTEAQGQAAHNAFIQAAREAARRGDWQRALPVYDSAVADNRADALRLRIERLIGYFALNDVARLDGELTALENEPLGKWRAQVNLLQGCRLLCDPAKYTAGRERITAALAEREHLFSAADAAFAEGLVQEKLTPALAAFRRALALDPLHFPANTSLAVALIGYGDYEAAERQINFVRSVYPEAPAGDLLAYLLAFVTEKRDEMHALGQRILPRLPPERQAEFRIGQALLDRLYEIRVLGNRMVAAEGEESVQLFAEVRRMQIALVNEKFFQRHVPFGLPVPSVGLLIRRLYTVFSTYLEVGLPAARTNSVPPAARKRLRELHEDAPDAILLLLDAISETALVAEALQKRDIPIAQQHLTRGTHLAEKSIAAPCLLLNGPISYMGRGLCLIGDIAVLKLQKEPDPGHLLRLRNGLRPLIAEGAAYPSKRRAILRFLVEMATVEPGSGEQWTWNLDDPNERAAYHARSELLLQLCGRLLDDLAIDAPDDPILAELRGQIAAWRQRKK